MSYCVVWDEKAREFLQRIHKPDAVRIIRKVNSAISDPKHYLETLVDVKCYKLRVGDYRVLVDVDDAKKQLSVLYIGHRKDIYQYLRRSRFMRK